VKNKALLIELINFVFYETKQLRFQIDIFESITCFRRKELIQMGLLLKKNLHTL